MQDRKLLEVTVVTDDDTGIYGIGDMDFGIPMETFDWVQRPGNREKLADMLGFLALAVRHGTQPFTLGKGAKLAGAEHTPAAAPAPGEKP